MSERNEKGTVSLNKILQLRRENPGDPDLLDRLIRESVTNQSNYADPTEEEPSVSADVHEPDVEEEKPKKQPEPAPKKAPAPATKKRPAPEAEAPPPAKKPTTVPVLPKPAKTAASSKPAAAAPAAPKKPKPASKLESAPPADASPYKPPKTAAAKPPPMSANIDTSNSKVFAKSLLNAETPSEALAAFLKTDPATVSRLPRTNPRLTIITLLGQLSSVISSVYSEVPDIAGKMKKMFNEQTAMATRRLFYEAVMDRLQTNRPPFHMPSLDFAKNTPNFNDAEEILDQNPASVQILLDNAMSQWYGKNPLLDPVIQLLQDARGASVHATVVYSEERYGAGLRCIMSNRLLKPNERSLCELQVMKPKGEIARVPIAPECRPVASALITDRLRPFMMTEDVATYLTAMNAGEENGPLAVAGALSATSGLGIFMAMRHLVRLVLAQLVLSSISPRIRS